MKVRVLIVFLLISFLGCKKDPLPPVVEPGPYFPAYPGSWWKYLVNDTITVIDSTSNDYIEYSYPIACKESRSEEKSIPMYHYGNGNSNWGIVRNPMPIYRYYTLESPAAPCSNFGYFEWKLLSEEIGDAFYRANVDPRSPMPTERLIVRGKTFEGNDSILVLDSFWKCSHYGDTLDEIGYQEFIKNVGMSLYIVVDTSTMDTLYTKRLIDYHINHNFGGN